MEQTRNGSEFLEYLRKQNGKQRQTFDAFYSYLEKKARIQGVPLSGEFELTPMCNLNCKMCYVHLSPEQMNNRELLTVEQWKDLMYQAYKAGMLHATLTGGECLTYPGFRELFLYLHSLGCEVSVFTNGALLNKDWIDFFKQHTPAEIQRTCLSLRKKLGVREQKDDPDTEMYIRILQYLASLSGRQLKTIKETQLPEPGTPVKPTRHKNPDCKSSERDKSSSVESKNSCDACEHPLKSMLIPFLMTDTIIV